MLRHQIGEHVSAKASALMSGCRLHGLAVAEAAFRSRRQAVAKGSARSRPGGNGKDTNSRIAGAVTAPQCFPSASLHSQEQLRTSA
jgi:hypothetical protein